MSISIVPAPTSATLESAADALPPLAELLTMGGDDRLALLPDGDNRYGCPPTPDPALLDFGSSTASAISEAGWATAQQLHHRLNGLLAAESPEQVYASELPRMRGELAKLLDVADIPGLDIVFAASGTDLHLLAGLLLRGACPQTPLAILMEACETGSGVPSALAGRHFGYRTALGAAAQPGAPLSAQAVIETRQIALRFPDGSPRAAAEIDDEVERAVGHAAAAGRQVLLTLLDVSKTGLIAPSPRCAEQLRRAWPGQVDVLVDACQMRLSSATLRGYLERGFLVALTGSKFIAGPSFSGALLIPAASGQRLRRQALPAALAAYSSAADWPAGWRTAGLPRTPNFGLLLRWEAALEELRAFRRVPEIAMAAFLGEFAQAVSARLERDPRFDPLRTPAPTRNIPGIASSWDHIPTIFPFLLRRSCGTLLNRQQTAWVYRGLQIPPAQPRARLGQPVLCGVRDGIPVSALRLSISARMVAGAGEPDALARLIKQAMAVLDHAARLADAS